MLKSFLFKHIVWIRIFALIGLTSVYLLPFFSPQGIQEDLHLSFRIDYILHFLVFAFMGFIFLVKSKRKSVILVLLFFIAYSCAMEFIQQEFLNRTFNPLDILANFIGLLIGLFCVYIFQKL